MTTWQEQAEQIIDRASLLYQAIRELEQETDSEVIVIGQG